MLTCFKNVQRLTKSAVLWYLIIICFLRCTRELHDDFCCFLQEQYLVMFSRHNGWLDQKQYLDVLQVWNISHRSISYWFINR